ncbi:MAG: hypothetical protein E7168_03595 [Firmicutes bacterium]|nr:hypothetical protein [Bacillota bacterium]
MLNEHYYCEGYVLNVHSGKLNETDSEYQMILSALKKRCQENGVEYDDTGKKANTLLATVVNEVNQKNQTKLFFSSVDNFEQELINQINNLNNLPIDEQIITIDAITNEDFMHNRITSIMELLRKHISERLSELIYDIDRLINAEEYKIEFDPFTEIDGPITIGEEEKKDFKEKIELFLMLSKVSKIFSINKKYANQLYEIKSNLLIEKEKIENPKYIEELEELVNHDNNFTYYYHGAPSKKIAEKITTEGLYMQYGEMSRTAVPNLSVSKILTYSYGHDAVGKHAIVVISVPKGENVIEINRNNDIRLSGTGQGKALYYEFKPTYVIPSKYIIGYIDKDSKKVIKNPNYYLNNNQIQENLENQAEMMVQAMVNGQIDINGQAITQSEESIHNRNMGYTKIGILVLIISIISIIMFTMGIILLI